MGWIRRSWRLCLLSSERALSAALLISGDGDREPGSRVVGVAVLGVLRALARSGPLLLAVDDVQWLDISSRSVLSFALRRLDHEPVRLHHVLPHGRRQ